MSMTYGEPKLRALEDFIVSADLAQAIGRVRPLQRETNVFVITNASLGDWDVEQFTAAELFDVRLPTKKDAAENYRRVSDIINGLLKDDGWVTFNDILRASGMPKGTGADSFLRTEKQGFCGMHSGQGPKTHVVLMVSSSIILQIPAQLGLHAVCEA